MENKTIQAMLIEAFEKNKDKIAIESGGSKITYCQLWEKSIYISNWLRTQNYNPGSKIGILVENRIEYIPIIIGVLMARCIFVPIGHGQPIDKIKRIIDFSNISTLFIDEYSLLKYRNSLSIDYTIINKIFYLNNVSCYNDNIEYSQNDPIYLYFTSGTTGVPKAILGLNKSLVHFINWEANLLNEMGLGLRVSQIISPGFDAYLRDIFLPICNGGTICIFYGNVKYMKAQMLIQWVESNNINVIHCSPSIFRLFNTKDLNESNFPFLKYVLLAGEKIYPNELIGWFDTFGDRIKLINMYGATETTMIKTFYAINPSDGKREIIPIGRPIAGSEVYILNSEQKECAIGEMGEIYISNTFGTLVLQRN